MHHGRLQETEPVGAQGNFQFLIRRKEAVLQGHMKILANHLLGLRRGNDFRFRIGPGQGQKGTAVVRLHMVDDDIVQLPAMEKMGYVVHKNITNH